MVAPDGPGDAGPGLCDAKPPRSRAADGPALSANDHGQDARKRQRCRTRNHGRRSRTAGDHDASGLGLPPSVDDRTAPAADNLVIPHPGIGVDGFAHGAEHPEGRTVVGKDVLVASRREHTNGRRRRVEHGDAMTRHHVPVPARIRVGRGGLEQQSGCTVGERTVDDVGVARDPTDVSHAGVDVIFAQVEGRLVRVARIDEVPAAGVNLTLGLAGRAARVEDEERILGSHLRGREVLNVWEHPLDIAIRGPRHLASGALEHHHALDLCEAAQRLVAGALERHDLAATESFVLGDDELCSGVDDAITQGLGGETAEDH